MDRYIDLSVISILRYKLILKFFWRLRKMRYICSVLHIQRQTEACFILKSGIFNACKVRCTKIQRLFNPVLLLNGVATAFEVCRTTGHGQPFLSYNANKSFHKMADIKIFDNPQFGEVRTAGTSDEPLFCLADICRVLDLQVSSTKNRLKQDGVSLIKVTDSLGREQMTYFINEQNMYRVIMRSDKPQAEQFQDWVCGEVLPSIRKTGQYLNNNVNKITVKEKMEAATWAAKFLRLNDCSKLMIAKHILSPYEFPLPDYVESKGTLKSATELLKSNNLQTKTMDFNRKMIESGLMCELSRNSSHGKQKLFKSLTKLGLRFGENQVSPHNPKETQPLYYEDKFSDLVKELGIN